MNKLNRIVVLSGFATLAATDVAGDLKAFVTDGCSVFPEGTSEDQRLWLNCCTDRHYAYWQGGTYKARLAADLVFRQCVATVREKDMTLLMLSGARVGGSTFFPTAFRWAHEWPYPKFYAPLNQDQLKQIERHKKADENRVAASTMNT
jgi:hypothetical protein